MNKLNTIQLNNPTDYESYYSLVEKLVDQQKTTGPVQTEELSDYTKLNLQRMKRWNKHAKPNDTIVQVLSKISRKMTWVIITEAWCGDAAQNIPFIANLAATASNVNLKIVLRDENHPLMNQYLTNGGMSIPKLILFDSESGNELGTWGPRPAEVQKLVINYKKHSADTIPYSEFSEQVHLWYAKNRNQDLSAELLSLLQQINLA